MREKTSEVIFKNSGGEYRGKGIAYSLFEVNIETKETGNLKLKNSVYHPAIFSPDLEYYTDKRSDQKEWFLNSVDGKVNIQLDWDYNTQHLWLQGSQKIIYSTKEGLKTIDLNGKITQITTNGNDKIAPINY
jgi:hypothetical protein